MTVPTAASLTSRKPAAFLMALILAISLLGVWSVKTANAVDCTVNPIPCENQLTGTSPTVWDTPNGDAGSPNLQGFATDISVNVGQTVNFKINSSNLSSYSI